MAESASFAQAPCYTCQTVFAFDPETVPSMAVDPQTNKALIATLGADPIVTRRARFEPICPTCVSRLQPLLKAAGLPVWREQYIQPPG